MDTNTKTASSRSTNTEASQQFRDMAETGAKQSKEALEKIGAATNEAAEVMTNCCSTALKGIQDYNNKVVEFTQANTNRTDGSIRLRADLLQKTACISRGVHR